MSEYIVELDSKHSIALKLAFAEEMRGGDFVRGEIVRCRDCRHSDTLETAPSVVVRCCYWSKLGTPRVVGDDGFCAWPEKREDS